MLSVTVRSALGVTEPSDVRPSLPPSHGCVERACPERALPFVFRESPSETTCFHSSHYLLASLGCLIQATCSYMVPEHATLAIWEFAVQLLRYLCHCKAKATVHGKAYWEGQHYCMMLLEKVNTYLCGSRANVRVRVRKCAARLLDRASPLVLLCATTYDDVLIA